MTRAPDLRALAAKSLGAGLPGATTVRLGIIAERLSGGNVGRTLLGHTLAAGVIVTLAWTFPDSFAGSALASASV